MFRFDEGLTVCLHREPVDFRLSINGLAVQVEQALGLDPFAPCASVSSHRRRDRVRILHEAEALAPTDQTPPAVIDGIDDGDSTLVAGRQRHHRVVRAPGYWGEEAQAHAGPTQ